LQQGGQPTCALERHQRRPPPSIFQRQRRVLVLPLLLPVPGCFTNQRLQGASMAGFSRRQQHGGARSREPATFRLTTWPPPLARPTCPIDFGEGAADREAQRWPGKTHVARPPAAGAAGAPPGAEIAGSAGPGPLAWAAGSPQRRGLPPTDRLPTGQSTDSARRTSPRFVGCSSHSPWSIRGRGS